MPNEQKANATPPAFDLDKLTAENRKKFINKYNELLMLQEYEAGKLEHIKVNLPFNEDAESKSAGEGVFVLVYPDAKAAYDADETGTTYEGFLDNDSYYYPELKHGVKIPIKMQGETRPVVPYNWLFENYGAAVNWQAPSEGEL